MELPHYYVFKQKVSKLIELWNFYSIMTKGHKGLKHSGPLSQAQLIVSKSKLTEN